MRAVMGGGPLIAGRYRLSGPIGRGAMGIVWHGRDELLARDVAVKEIQIPAQAMPADAELIYQRTLREARAAARLSHAGAVTVFDVVEENGSPWIVMELVDGRSLDRVIAEDGPLPPSAAAELGSGLIGALASAHSAGVLHRDVKPSNVLVAADGRAVLTDFGLATFAGDPGQTQTGMVVGTPGFTAPERVRGGPATPASDLWSLGATLYAAVEGRGPFDRAGGADAVTIGVAMQEAPRAPSAGPLGAVIDALLQRDPGARPDAATTARLLAEATATAAIVPSDSAILDAPVFAELSMPRPDRPDDLVVPPDLDASADRSQVTGLNMGAGLSPAASIGDAASGARSDDPHLGPDDGAPVLWQPVRSASGSAGGSGPVTAGPDDGAPVLWQPVRPASGSTGGSGPVTGELAASVGGGGADGPGYGDNCRSRGGRPRRRSGRWRLLLAGVGVAAMGAAAIVGWYLVTDGQTTQALQNPATPGITVRGSSAGGGPGGSGAGGNPSNSAPTAGGSAGAVASNKQPAGVGDPSAGTSASPTTSPAPSPTPGSTAPVLPPGYIWHRFTAAGMGTAAGFEIGMPSGWQQSVTALAAHLNAPGSNVRLTVDLAPWTLAGPLAEADHLELQAARADPGYRLVALRAIGFRAVGGYVAAPAAELRFHWTRASTGTVTELVILVTLDTTSGPQPYAFTLTAPTATFGSGDGIFLTAMPTFRPLPG
jgi:eukaryotic-like serine/threonine-protein kinase